MDGNAFCLRIAKLLGELQRTFKASTCVCKTVKRSIKFSYFMYFCPLSIKSIVRLCCALTDPGRRSLRHRGASGSLLAFRC